MEHQAVGAERTVRNEAKAMSCLCLGVSRSQGTQCGFPVTPDCCHYKQPQPGRDCARRLCHRARKVAAFEGVFTTHTALALAMFLPQKPWGLAAPIPSLA